MRMPRIGLAFTGITTGMWLLFAPTADAGSLRTPHTMTRAMAACAPAPHKTRPACHSLHLRPRIGNIPAGHRIVAECYTMAADEHRPGTRRWGTYLNGCFRGNIETP